MRAGRDGDWPVRAALALLVLLFFRDALAGGVLFERDVHLIWVPQIEGFVHAVAGGALPLWDPSPAFGQPLLADPQAQVLYPPTWLNLVLRPWLYSTLYAMGHLLLSITCLSALARRWGLSRLAAAAAGCVWGLSGPLLSLVNNSHHFAGACYLPVVFLTAEIALETRRARDVARLGLAFGLQILAGSADMCAMTLLSLVVWNAIVRVDWWRDRRALLGLLARGTAALLLAAAIGAGTWTAALGAVSRSSRQSLPEGVRTFWSVHPASVSETLLAGVPAGLPLAPRWREALSEGREPFLGSLYLGLPCLALVVAAFRRKGGRRQWALATLGLGALLVALGRYAPFYRLAITLVPPLAILRYPVKATIVMAFAWAGLAGFGVEASFAASRVDRHAAPASRWHRILFVLLPLAVCAASAGLAAVMMARPSAVAFWMQTSFLPASLMPVARGLVIHALLGAAVALLTLLTPRSSRQASLVAGGAAILAIADLLVAHPRPNPVAPAALYRHRPETLAAIGDPQAARVYSYVYWDPARPKDVPGLGLTRELVRQPAGWSPAAALALAEQIALAPETPERWGLRQAFEVDYKGLQPEPVVYLARLVRLREQNPDDLLRLLRVSAVTHVIAQHRLGGDRLRLVAEVPGLFALPTLVLEVPDPLPRARVVAGVRSADGFAALNALLAPDFDPERTVLLPEGPSVPAPFAFHGSAAIVAERADRVRIEAELGGDGYVVLADTYDPGWRVRVDGRPARLLRANVAFRAVAVPAGRHRVEMVYRPALVLVAVAVTLASLLATLVFLLAPRRRRSVDPRG